MAILLHTGPLPADPWRAALAAAMPDEELRTVDDDRDAADIEAALLGGLPPGLAARCPNLKMIGWIMAGVDRLFADPDLSPDIPVVRCGGPDGDSQITEYVALHVLRHHRQTPVFAEAQARREWFRPVPVATAKRRVGFLGLGLIARPAAEAVVGLGFDVAAWTRTARETPGIANFNGADGLAPFLARTDILVNLLPLTDATRNILDARLFETLPQGAAVINVGRGEHLVDSDLMAALDSGHLAAATLDVFRTEPLPADDPLWAHPRITLMPHVARQIRPDDIVPQFVDAIGRLRAGEALIQTVDRAAGY